MLPRGHEGKCFIDLSYPVGQKQNDVVVDTHPKKVWNTPARTARKRWGLFAEQWLVPFGDGLNVKEVRPSWRRLVSRRYINP